MDLETNPAALREEVSTVEKQVDAVFLLFEDGLLADLNALKLFSNTANHREMQYCEGDRERLEKQIDNLQTSGDAVTVKVTEDQLREIRKKGKLPNGPDGLEFPPGVSGSDQKMIQEYLYTVAVCRMSDQEEDQ